jgi:hypothetical protein
LVGEISYIHRTQHWGHCTHGRPSPQSTLLSAISSPGGMWVRCIIESLFWVRRVSWTQILLEHCCYPASSPLWRFSVQQLYSLDSCWWRYPYVGRNGDRYMFWRICREDCDE